MGLPAQMLPSRLKFTSKRQSSISVHKSYLSKTKEVLCSIVSLNPPSAITVHLPKTSARSTATLVLLKQAVEREDTGALQAKPDHSSLSQHSHAVSSELNVMILHLHWCLSAPGILTMLLHMLLSDFNVCAKYSHCKTRVGVTKMLTC